MLLHRPVIVDAELGPVRYCRGCDEWWPDESDFYGMDATVCRACEADARLHRRSQVREAGRRFRARRRMIRMRLEQTA